MKKRSSNVSKEHTRVLSELQRSKHRQHLSSGATSAVKPGNDIFRLLKEKKLPHLSKELPDLFSFGITTQEKFGKDRE